MKLDVPLFLATYDLHIRKTLFHILAHLSIPLVTTLTLVNIIKFENGKWIFVLPCKMFKKWEECCYAQKYLQIWKWDQSEDLSPKLIYHIGLENITVLEMICFSVEVCAVQADPFSLVLARYRPNYKIMKKKKV